MCHSCIGLSSILILILLMIRMIMCCVASVHDRQLVDDIPVEKLLIHDVPVDVVCTPTQVIFTDTSIPKPQGV